MEILTLLKANLKHKKGSFFSILLLMLIISTVLTSVISIKSNMETRVRKAHETAGTGDLFLFLEEQKLTDDLIAKTEACHSVSKVKVQKNMLMKSTSINGENVPVQIFIESFDNDIYPYELLNETYNDFVTEKDKLSDDEVLLPISMKDSYSCKIGDSVSFDIGTEKINLTIAGFIEEPITGTYVMSIKSLVVTSHLFQKIRNDSHIEENPNNEYIWDGNMVHIFATDVYKDRITEVSKEINKETSIVSLSFTSITKEQDYSYTLLMANILCGVLEAFVFILFIVVILVLSNNINSSIEMDYTNIGILKSQGFTRLQIRLVLLIQYLFSAICGVLLGMIFAIPIVHTLRNMFINTSGLLFSGNLALLKSAGLMTIILLILAIYILLKTRRISKITPVTAISGGLDTIYFKNVLETPVIGKSKSFLNLKLAFRQLTSNTGWYVGTCLIIGLLISFLCMSASFKENFTEKYYKEIFGVVARDVNVEYGDHIAKRSEVEATIASVTPIKKTVYYDDNYVLTDEEQNHVQILDDTSLFVSILEGRAPKYDNEIVVTNLVSDDLGKKVGETVEIQIQKTKKDYVISGIYDSCSDLGRTIGMSLDGMRRIDPEYKIDVYSYILEDSSKSQAVIDAVNATYRKTDNITATESGNMNNEGIDVIMLTSNMVMLIICLISITFVIIVICMICNKMFLKERQSLGIYKAYGFTTANLRFQYCFRFLLVALFGCLLGGMVFVFFGNAINGSLLKMAGISTYSAPITWFNLGLPILLICLTVFLSSYITMRKVKKVDVKALIVE